MTHTPPLSPDTLLALAPAQLTTYRGDRYLGDALNVLLTASAPADQEITQQLYAHLQMLLQVIEAKYGHLKETTTAIQLFTR